MGVAFARVHAAFLLSIETGMRAGEMAGLTWDCIDIDCRVAHLPRTKNGRARDVPLSLEAVRILQALDRPDVFGMTSPNMSARWVNLRDKAGVSRLGLHDARHEAVTRLSKKLDVLALAKMIGHRDIKMLMTYYDEDAADLARRLD
jgi:integrase